MDLKLTGNPFVDNGLAAMSALCNCKRIEDLTLRSVKNMHVNGRLLARNNIRLDASKHVFINSIIQQPKYSEQEKIKRYSKATKILVNNIGHEDLDEYCDLCGSEYSMDIDKLYTDGNGEGHFVGRNWIPLSGSLKKDSQAMPTASRSLNACAKCLLACQYLPMGSIVINGLLAVFKSTSTDLWYQFVRKIVNMTRVSTDQKVETFGRREGSRQTINTLLSIMKDVKRHDASMIMYQYSNMWGGQLRKQLIPNNVLNFLQECSHKGVDNEILDLTSWEIKGTGDNRRERSYRGSLFNKITRGEDYKRLYKNEKADGASPKLFLLYQTHIMKYPVDTLYTAWNIAQYLKSYSDIDPANIERSGKKQKQVKKWVIRMVEERLITLDQFYGFFVRPSLDFRNVWWLVKYYLSVDTNFKYDGNGQSEVYNKTFKDNVVRVGTMIYDKYLQEKGPIRMQKLLGKFANKKIGRNWLMNRFQELHDEHEDFDYSDNWRAVCVNEDGKEDIYRFIDLIRVLFVAKLNGHL